MTALDDIDAPEHLPEQAVRAFAHELLLRLAGRVPDDVLALLRELVAGADHDGADHDGADQEEAAAILEGAFRADRIPVTLREAELARYLLDVWRATPGVLDRVSLLPAEPGLAFTFARPTASELADPVATAVASAAADLGGVTGVFLVGRRMVEGIDAGAAPEAGPRLVHLVELAAGADPVQVTAGLQDAAAAAGDAGPRVEVFAVGAELPGYHRAALGAAALTWYADPAPVQLARVFDGVDPATGPHFHPGHPTIDDEPTRERLVAYLRAGTGVLLTPGLTTDVVDPARGTVVPLSFRTDGTWVWTDTVTYYLARHRLAPQPELVAHIGERAAPAPVGRVGMRRVLEFLDRKREQQAAGRAG
jgi:hypothetical protein